MLSNVRKNKIVPKISKKEEIIVDISAKNGYNRKYYEFEK